MKNPFTAKFWIIVFFALCFLLGLGASRILPQTEKQFPFLVEDKQEKPFCNQAQMWLWDERQKAYWNQAYCHHRFLRQKNGFPRLFTAEEITEGGKIKPSKY
jgi:hypothetical protein